MDKINKIKELITLLNNASRKYYNGIESDLTDAEFDKMFEELQYLEQETGFVMSNSPTKNVGYESITEQKKIKHTVPMLSLKKCHYAQEIVDFAGNYDVVAMFKMDGISLRAIYNENGDLAGLESRGNGEEGTDLFYQRFAFDNIPLHIDVNRRTVVDGEAIITEDDFQEINKSLPKSERYSHSRNLAAGSLALLDTSISSQRHLKMIVWDVIEGNDNDSLFDKLLWAKDLGFDIVDACIISSTDSITEERVNEVNEQIFKYAKELGYGIDGVVWKYDSVSYGKSLGRTSHHFNCGIAYKREMEIYETTLEDVLWQTSKTGAINPVAKFTEVDLGGALTTKATLHNISYIENLELGVGDKIGVIRSNEVIPRVVDNYTRSGSLKYPTTCPCCGAPTVVKNDNGSKMLYCTGTNCSAQLLAKLSHAVSRNALNIDGLSEATLETLINRGWIKSFKDIYHLSDFKTEMTSISGFGVKSVNKLLNAIEDSRNTTLDRFLYSLSIPLIGRSVSKDIANYCHNSVDEFIFVIENEINKLMTIDGIGIAVVNSLDSWWTENSEMFHELLEELTIEVPEEKKSEVVDNSSDLNGQSFCITGKLVHYSNRDALVADIEAHNGIVCSGVTKKTNYLLTNDTTSGSSKNKKAAELGIPVITEEDFMRMIGKTN